MEVHGMKLQQWLITLLLTATLCITAYNAKIPCKHEIILPEIKVSVQGVQEAVEVLAKENERLTREIVSWEQQNQDLKAQLEAVSFWKELEK
jgi:cell division protein FtsB